MSPRHAQDKRGPTCYVCGTAEGVVEVHPHNWLCPRDLPAGAHVVSNHGSPGNHLAVCQCGWRSRAGHYQVQHARVQMHWREAIRRTLAEYRAIHGKGELAGLAASLTVLAGVAVALLAALP